MDNNIRKQLQKWHDNNLISQETFNEIVKFENNSIPTQKSKVARAITLIGSLFVLSGLLGTLPLIWMNLAYWAQLLLLIIITGFLFYAASYSEKFEEKLKSKRKLYVEKSFLFVGISKLHIQKLKMQRL